MYLSKSPTFRFWVTVYAFPAMVPLIVNVAFIYMVRSDLVASFGIQGQILANHVSLALTVSFVALVLMANCFAWWHAARQSPPLPIPPMPNSLSN
jgi:hypothetical protein